MLNDARLDALRRWTRERKGRHCVSLFMPVDSNGPAVRRNPIRLRNLLKEAEKRLADRGAASDEIEALLAPARALVLDEERWKRSRAGLALLCADGEMLRYDWPKPFADAVHVGDVPYVKPLLSDRVPDDRFYVLAISRDDVQLWAGDLDGLTPMDAPAIPKDIEAGLGEEIALTATFKQHSVVRAGSPTGGAVFHGQGKGIDETDQMERFLRVVDKGVCETIDDPSRPLVLVGVTRNVSIYRAISRWPTLVGTSIQGDPGAFVEDDELLRAAWPLVLPMLRARELEERRRLRRLWATARVSTDLGDVLSAAEDGRIQTLFAVAEDQRLGHFDPSTRTLRLDGEPDAVDLVELAVERALDQDAEVFTSPRHLVPGGGVVAATYRY